MWERGENIGHSFHKFSHCSLECKICLFWIRSRVPVVLHSTSITDQFMNLGSSQVENVENYYLMLQASSISYECITECPTNVHRKVDLTADAAQQFIFSFQKTHADSSSNGVEEKWVKRLGKTSKEMKMTLGCRGQKASQKQNIDNTELLSLATMEMI